MSIDGFEKLSPSYGELNGYDTNPSYGSDDYDDYLYKRYSHFKDVAKRITKAKKLLVKENNK